VLSLLVTQEKPSIATTVSEVLKYIPELQTEVENLERRKKKLMNANCKRGVANLSGSTAPIVSVNCLNEMEIMVQVSFLSNSAEAALPFSVCIEVLENEGLHLISSSTFSPTENRTFYSLHLQVHYFPRWHRARLMFIRPCVILTLLIVVVTYFKAGY
jgi:hypothetical protein